LASSALVFGAIWYDRRFWFSSIVFVSQGWKSLYWGFVFTRVLLTSFLLQKYSRILKFYFLGRLWFLFNLFSFFVFSRLLAFSTKSIEILDQGWLECCGPEGVLRQFVSLAYGFMRYFFFFFLSGFIFFFLLI
jgi:hypothetical protein